MQGSFSSTLGWLVAAGLLACPRLASGQDERLPLQVIPVYQDIELALDPQQPGYTGSASLKLRVKEKVDRFAFHAKGLTLQEVGLRRGNTSIALQHQAAERTGIVWVT